MEQEEPSEPEKEPAEINHTGTYVGKTCQSAGEEQTEQKSERSINESTGNVCTVFNALGHVPLLLHLGIYTPYIYTTCIM